ncbi:hypothetical protein [Acidocella aquatica]|uniref:hypothetical protein n=1 Tax=Acidocella aquatica TaxID=1922313 RepID=UPI0024E0C31E|nr:hypothetical protein [Acidocella aquatica]
MELSRRLFRFGARIDALTQTINEYDHGTSLASHEIFIVERSLIQLQIEWELFIRNLILDCATGNYCDSSGPIVSKLPIRLSTREAACHVLLAQYRNQKRPMEPDWYLPDKAVQAATHLAVSNLQNITDQLGVTPWDISDLRYVRNFIVHRSKRSALTIRERQLVTGPEKIDPVSIAYKFCSSGIQNHKNWAQFIKLVAKNLAT